MLCLSWQYAWVWIVVWNSSLNESYILLPLLVMMRSLSKVSRCSSFCIWFHLWIVKWFMICCAPKSYWHALASVASMNLRILLITPHREESIGKFWSSVRAKVTTGNQHSSGVNFLLGRWCYCHVLCGWSSYSSYSGSTISSSTRYLSILLFAFHFAVV